MKARSGEAALRLGVIGVGHLGRHHVRVAASLSGATLVAAVDLIAERAEAAVRGTGAEALTDHRALFDRVDAVTVAVPTVDHLSVARDFLARGVHVLVEKPIAASLDEADELMRLAEASGAILAVGHSERFNPAFQSAQPLLERPRFIEVHRLSGFPERGLDIDVVFDLMIHDLDIVLAVDRTEVESVEAVGVPVLTPQVDIANARLRFASGCVANITASRISRDKVRKARYFQPDRYVSIDYAAQELEVFRLERQGRERPKIAGGPVPVARDEPLRLEIEDFARAVTRRCEPGVPGAEGRRALALATRVAGAIRAEGTAGQRP